MSSGQSPAHCSVHEAPPIHPSSIYHSGAHLPFYLLLSHLSFCRLVTHPFYHSWIHPPPHLFWSLPLSLPAPNQLPPCSRIYEILPQRIQQWQQSPCIAEEHGKKLLERIRREQQSARTRLQEMERRFHELEAIILRAKQQAVREDEEVSRPRPSGAGPST